MRKTREEFAAWLKKYIDLHHNGNNAEAGRKWGVDRATVHAVLKARIKPAEGILKGVGFRLEDTEIYIKGAK